MQLNAYSTGSLRVHLSNAVSITSVTVAGASVGYTFVPGTGVILTVAPNPGDAIVVNYETKVATKVPYILAQAGVPAGLAPNGTVATNGQVTLLTALPRVYSNGIWLRLPAGAVVGGAAGLYWCVMSSTTVGQVYGNFVDTSLGFIPFIPTGTLVNAVGSNAAYTQTTGSDIVLSSGFVPANAMGVNGSLRIKSLFSNNGNANSKVTKHIFGGYAFIGLGSTASSNQIVLNNSISNTGTASSQVSQSWGMSGASSAGVGVGSVDTSAQQLLTLTALITVATDYLILESCAVEVLPS